MTKINICNHKSTGLQNDSKILKDLLERQKYVVCTTEYEEIKITKIEQNKQYDIQIFLEHICPNLLKNAKENIYIPNLEMISKLDYEILVKTNYITKIIAKTDSCYNILRNHPEIKQKILQWKWNSIDRNIPEITPDYNQYLHVKGQSRFKQSQMIINLWLKHPEWPMLNIVHHGNINGNGYLEIKKPITFDNITIYQYKLEEDELKELMNKCGVHICTSFIEGYGHYINEARSVGAVIITPDCEPMNEMVNKNGLLIKVEEKRKYNFGISNVLNENELKNTLIKCFYLDEETKIQMGNISKKLYQNNAELFYKSSSLK